MGLSYHQAEGVMLIDFFGTGVVPFIYYFPVGAARRLPGGWLQVRLHLHLASCLPWHLALYSAWYIHCTPPCTWKGHYLKHGVMLLILPKIT